MKDILHEESVRELFRASPSYVADLLVDVQRDGNPDELAILQRQIIAAFWRGWIGPHTVGCCRANQLR